MGLRVYHATARTHVSQYGRCFPAISTLQNRNPIRCTKMIVTSYARDVLGSGGTLHLVFQATAPQNWNGPRQSHVAIPLTNGESIEFNGLRRGDGSIEEMVFGTGYSYIVGLATGRHIKCTYYQWE